MILVLGGTIEGRQLASALADSGQEALLSLAGRTTRPRTVGPVRSGGFGGAAGLARFLVEQGISCVVDATHPFAQTMTCNAVLACEEASVPLLRLARPGWAEHQLAKTWTWVGDHAEAAFEAASAGAPVMLTVGRQHAVDYVPALGASPVLIRVAEAPDEALPEGWQLICSTGPFTLAGERQVMQEHGIQVLVTKDAGGAATEAKLWAAAELGVKVVVLRRHATPAGLRQVATIAEAVDWAVAQAGNQIGHDAVKPAATHRP